MTSPSNAATNQRSPSIRSAERIIIDVWSRILRVEIAADTNFFQVGGESLLALKATNETNRLLGTKASVTDLLKSPTPRQLAERYMPDQTADAYVDCLVPIQANSLGKRVLLVHPLNGQCESYGALVAQLGPGVEVVGLQSPRTQHGYLEGITRYAEHYANAIQARFESVDVILGWSIGGLIAFELVRELERREVTVGALVPVGTTVPDLCRAEQATPAELDDMVPEAIRATIPDPAAFARLTDEQKIDYLVDMMRGSDSRHKSIDGASAKSRLQRRGALLNSIARYVPEPGARVMSAVHLILTETESDVEQYTSGWRRYAGSTLSVTHVPGSHGEAMSSPAADHVAKTVRSLVA